MWIPIGRTLLDEETIGRRLDELAEEISRDYADSGEVVLVGVLRGAFVFLADLCRRLELPVMIDFVAVSSYEAGEKREEGEEILLDVRTPIEGRHVIVVEDIVDSGRTVEAVRRVLAEKGPRSLAVCTLLCKPEALEVDVSPDYVGFDIPDEWVVGYGLDYDHQHRALPRVAVVEPPE